MTTGYLSSKLDAFNEREGGPIETASNKMERSSATKVSSTGGELQPLTGSGEPTGPLHDRPINLRDLFPMMGWIGPRLIVEPGMGRL